MKNQRYTLQNILILSLVLYATVLPTQADNLTNSTGTTASNLLATKKEKKSNYNREKGYSTFLKKITQHPIKITLGIAIAITAAVGYSIVKKPSSNQLESNINNHQNSDNGEEELISREDTVLPQGAALASSTLIKSKQGNRHNQGNDHINNHQNSDNREEELISREDTVLPQGAALASSTLIKSKQGNRHNQGNDHIDNHQNSDNGEEELIPREDTVLPQGAALASSPLIKSKQGNRHNQGNDHIDNHQNSDNEEKKLIPQEEIELPQDDRLVSSTATTGSVNHGNNQETSHLKSDKEHDNKESNGGENREKSSKELMMKLKRAGSHYLQSMSTTTPSEREREKLLQVINEAGQKLTLNNFLEALTYTISSRYSDGIDEDIEVFTKGSLLQQLIEKSDEKIVIPIYEALKKQDPNFNFSDDIVRTIIESAVLKEAYKENSKNTPVTPAFKILEKLLDSLEKSLLSPSPVEFKLFDLYEPLGALGFAAKHAAERVFDLLFGSPIFEQLAKANATFTGALNGYVSTWQIQQKKEALPISRRILNKVLKKQLGFTDDEVAQLDLSNAYRLHFAQPKKEDKSPQGRLVMKVNQAMEDLHAHNKSRAPNWFT